MDILCIFCLVFAMPTTTSVMTSSIPDLCTLTYFVFAFVVR